MMSSMWRAVIFVPALLAPAASVPAQAQYASGAPVGYALVTPVATSLDQWRRLRQSSGYSFGDYAQFLIANPDWPDASKMRGWAEKAMRPGEYAATVVAFFAKDKPKTGNGWARLADAYAAIGRPAEAAEAARRAWSSADLSSDDEQAIWSRYGTGFSRLDNDNRVDALLFAKKADSAARFLAMTSPQRQPAFAARISMQQNSSDAEARYSAVMGLVTSDAGLMADRIRYLRSNNYGAAAQTLAARDHRFVYKPADTERFLELLLATANDAAASGQWQTVVNIANQLDDALPAGASVPDQSLGVRDDYTSLAWLGGSAALDRLRSARSALYLFDRYARAGRSLQVQTKGDYWAGRAATAAGDLQTANNYFQRAAAFPDLFYGQLALERLGRAVPPPPAALPQYTTTTIQRSAFNSRPIVQALRVLRQQGQTGEQALFVQALANSLDTDVDRNLALELEQQLGRQDIAVWVARAARIKGSSFYVSQAYPTLNAPLSSDMWSLAHGIGRQESSFDPNAVSHAGARGIMQLMPGTAAEQAGKIGVNFDSYRLTGDPNYNISLGASYFRRMLNIWNGNVPLAVASYNAGSGNVGKWVRRYGDPRSEVDMVGWIESIPFTETRGYVQRVIENMVVYDSLRGGQTQQSAFHVSRYLGKSRPG